MKKVKALLMVLLLVSILVPMQPVHADVAPPSQPSGSNVVPGEVTMVQMMSERVVIDLRPPWSDGIDADVTASFVMHNQGTIDEQMEVGFPLNAPGDMNPDGSITKLKDLIVKIDGLNVTPQYTSEDKWLTNKDQDAVAGDWAVFNVLFPVGKDISIEVNYKQPPKYDAPSTEYDYVLITGAGWYGPIGKGDIIFRLPYAISEGENYWVVNWAVTSENERDWLSSGIIVENEARWHFENLEPENNWGVYVVRPKDWERVLAARQALINNQYDAKLWKELGDAYSNAAIELGGKTYDSSFAAITAYEQSVTLKPDWADAHACLAFEYYKAFRDQEFYTSFSKNAPDKYLQQGALQELSVALALDANNEIALGLKQEIIGLGSDWEALPPPTPYATPTMDANATPLPTETPLVVTVIQTKLVYAPTTTPMPKPMETSTLISTAVPTETQEDANSSTIIFGVLLVFGLGAGSGWILSKRQKK